MKTNRKAAFLALGLALFAPVAGAQQVLRSEWWNVDFESPTPGPIEVDGVTYGNVEFVNGALGTLTNVTDTTPGKEVYQPYASGLWTAADGDESCVTNEYNPTNLLSAGWFGTNWCLKLDTQGNDLTWMPTNNPAVSNLATLVDADLYLVGSDSAPVAEDFDPTNAPSRVQTAVFLKNELDATGNTTNSVLCVYVEHPSTGASYWQELEGEKLEDNSWAHVQVVVDHSKANPMVSVFVNGTPMHARGGSATSWLAANKVKSTQAKKVSSVSFRGTGAVDNFAGAIEIETFESFDFTAQVFMNGSPVAVGNDVNQSKVVHADAGNDKSATFDGFKFHDYSYDEVTEIETLTYSLTRIVISNCVDGSVETFNYGYDRESGVTLPERESPNIVFDTDTAEDEETGKEYEYYSGPFTVTASTAGATKDETIVYIYFEDLPEEGDFKLTATQNVGTPPLDQKFNTNTLSVSSTTFTFAQSLTDGGKSYILSTLTVGATPAGIEAAVSGTDVVVTVPLNDQIAEGVYNVATATYVEGSLADGETLQGSRDGNVYTYTKYTPPVAIIVAGALTNGYDSLRGAITNATAGDTIYLVRDDAVSFTVDDPVVVIDKAVTIDGGSNKVYGVSAYDFSNEGIRHAFRITGSGNVTIKDLTLTEFGGSAPTVQYYTYPIWTLLDYTGTVTLDNVTVEKFARTAFNFIGGSFEVKNCTIDGYGDDPGCPATFFQDGIDVYDATGWVSNTVMTGLGSANTDESASFFLMHDGSITVYDGTYGSDYAVGFSTAYGSPAGTVDIRGGSFVTGKAGAMSNFMGDTNNVTVTISGGWFTLEPEAAFITNGYKAVEAAPGTATPWTVAKPCTIKFFEEDGTTEFFRTNVLSGATGYGPTNDPPKDADAQYTYVFTGWTNTVAGGETVSTENLPAATGDAEWTATYSVILRSYEITFMTNDVVYATTNVAWHATDYGPADPAAPEGFTFDGWTNSVGGAAVAAADLPEVTGTATWNAVFTKSAVVKPNVNPGDGLKDYVPGEGETVPAPIEFTADAAPKCEISFVAPETGWYVLYSSTTVDGEYTEDTASGKTVAKGELTTLVETTPGNTKFFKIYWSASAPAGD